MTKRRFVFSQGVGKIGELIVVLAISTQNSQHLNKRNGILGSTSLPRRKRRGWRKYVQAAQRPTDTLLQIEWNPTEHSFQFGTCRGDLSFHDEIFLAADIWRHQDLTTAAPTINYTIAAISRRNIMLTRRGNSAPIVKKPFCCSSSTAGHIRSAR